VVQLCRNNVIFAVMSTSSVSEMSGCQHGSLTAMAAMQFNLGRVSMCIAGTKLILSDYVQHLHVAPGGLSVEVLIDLTVWWQLFSVNVPPLLFINLRHAITMCRVSQNSSGHGSKCCIHDSKLSHRCPLLQSDSSQCLGERKM